MTKRYIFIFAALLLITACAASPESQTGVEPAALPAVARTPVEVATVETGDISLVLNYTGNLKAQADIDVKPKLTGEIKTILVEAGDAVDAGTPLAVIDDELLQLDLQSAETALEKANLDLARMEAGARPEEIAAARSAVDLASAALDDVSTIDDDERTTAVLNLAKAEAELRRVQAEYDKIAWAGQVGTSPQAAQLEQATAAYEAALAEYNLKTNPGDSTLAPLEGELVQAQLNLTLALEPFRPFEFDIARTQIKQAEIGIEKANLQLDYATIKAPFDGVIASLDIEQGSLVSPQTNIARLISNEVEVEVSVEENRLGQVEVGQPASINVSAFPGVDFPAEVSHIPPLADGSTHTFEVVITPQDEHNLLRSGMFADVSILADVKNNALLVPRSALTIIDGQPVIYVVTVKNDSTAVERRDVTAGLRNKSQVEILDGLAVGESVVIQGQANLVDGADVVVVD